MKVPYDYIITVQNIMCVCGLLLWIPPLPCRKAQYASTFYRKITKHSPVSNDRTWGDFSHYCLCYLSLCYEFAQYVLDRLWTYFNGSALYLLLKDQLTKRKILDFFLLKLTLFKTCILLFLWSRSFMLLFSTKLQFINICEAPKRIIFMANYWHLQHCMVRFCSLCHVVESNVTQETLSFWLTINLIHLSESLKKPNFVQFSRHRHWMSQVHSANKQNCWCFHALKNMFLLFYYF